MDPAVLLPRFPGLKRLNVTVKAGVVVAEMVSTAARAACPRCGRRSRRIHSRYRRTLRDLPWADCEVVLILHVRRFRCLNPRCPRAVFTERLDDVVRSYGRRTDRTDASLVRLALATSCEAASDVAKHLWIPTSAPTLRRLLRRSPMEPPPAQPPPRVVGLDDWAKRKGRSYGTIFVDLERHRVLDVLPDRTAESVAAWLRDRPTIEIVARDRSGCYSDGVTTGAPQAVQVADRWHLLNNLGDAVQRFFERNPAALRLAAAELTEQHARADPPTTSAAGIPATEAAPAMSLRQAERRRQYETAKALRASGHSLVSIGRQLHLSRVTVARYVAAAELPRRGGTRVPSSVTPFLPILRER